MESQMARHFSNSQRMNQRQLQRASWKIRLHLKLVLRTWLQNQIHSEKHQGIQSRMRVNKRMRDLNMLMISGIMIMHIWLDFINSLVGTKGHAINRTKQVHIIMILEVIIMIQIVGDDQEKEIVETQMKIGIQEITENIKFDNSHTLVESIEFYNLECFDLEWC